MASIVLVLGVAIYYGLEKIQDHKEKKRELKTLLHGPVLDRSISYDDENASLHEDHPPTYEKEWLQPHPVADQHPALSSDKRRKRRFVFRM
jgi:hypothetical protein